MRLLLAEDDRIVRITVRDALEEAGYAVSEHADGLSAQRAVDAEAFDLVLTDVRLPGLDGLSLFRHVRRVQPGTPVVIMTAFADTADAVSVMRDGARDYLLKPFEIDELLLRLGRVRDEVVLRRGLTGGAPLAEMGLGSSAASRRMAERIEASAASDVPVLLTGETGTGKDLCARLIHERSARRERPFVVVNCAALPDALFESELFGHERGAFTGAERRRVGRFEAAHGGTLFLDEVGEIPPVNQAKLLRALETSSFEPVGATQPVQVDVRIISATNRDLAAEIARGAFRRDLFYRLNVIDIRTPALRERRDDIPGLVQRFLGDIARRQGRPVATLDPEVVAALVAHDYPGNVRELLHALERAVALARGGAVRLEHLPPEMTSERVASAPPDGAPMQPLGDAVQQFEEAYIRQALERTGGHRSRAAALLGISRKSLWERLRDARTPTDEAHRDED